MNTWETFLPRRHQNERERMQPGPALISSGPRRRGQPESPRHDGDHGGQDARHDDHRRGEDACHDGEDAGTDHGDGGADDGDGDGGDERQLKSPQPVVWQQSELLW